MYKIKNLTNSPYDLQCADGPVRLPAFGEIEGDFCDDYLDLLRASGAVSVEELKLKAASKKTTKPKV